MSTPTERKTQLFTVRVSPTVAAIVQRMAQDDRRSVSEWLRETIRREAERKGIWPAEAAPEVTA